MTAVIRNSKSLGNETSWNGGWVPKTRAHERYLLLISQMRAEHAAVNGSDWGWQTAVAKRLKITQSYLSKLTKEDDDRGLGLEPLEHAIRKVGISPLFFFSAFPTQPSYRDFVGPHKLPPPMTGYAAFAKFIEQAPAIGLHLTEAERHVLEQQEWPTEPSVASYMHLLSAIRACAAREDTRARLRPAPTG